MLKEKQSLLKARAKALQQAEDLIEELTERKDYYKQIAREQRVELTQKEKVLYEIIKLTESNTYNNDRLIINKIKELAETGINN